MVTLTLKTCKNAVKKLLFLKRCFRDRYNTQKMFDQVILENVGTLMFVPDCHKNYNV